MAAVEAGGALPHAEGERTPRHLVHAAADQVTQRVTAEGVAAQEHDVEEEDQAADVELEVMVGSPVEEPLVGVDGEDDQERERQVEEVAVDVLDDERQLLLAAVALLRLADRAGGGRGPVRLVVGASV